MHKWRTICLLFLPAAIGTAQTGTKLDLSNQAKNVDFSKASATRPVQTGNGSPVQNCLPGAAFFQLDAVPGQNLWVCTASPNSWTQLTTSGSGGSGGGGGITTTTSGLTDLSVARTSPTVLTVAGTCSVATPCRVRSGVGTNSIKAPAFLTMPANPIASGVVTIFVNANGALSAYSTVSPATPAVTGSGISVITSPPLSDRVPLAIWTANNGTWDTGGGTDLRAFIGNAAFSAGPGIVIGESPSGRVTVSADTTSIGVRVAVPTAASSSCTQGNYAFDGSFLYHCIATDTWRRVAISSW